MKKVSAIITTHNRDDLLKRAIESVLNQTYDNIECIVVDDNSTDNTREICSLYPIHYIYIPKSESHGGNYARNIGVKASTGDYCAFLDDDDYWLSSKIEKQVMFIEKYGCDFVFCGRKLEEIKNNKTIYKDILPKHSLNGDMSKMILYTICTTTSCILLSRKTLITIGLFDEDLNFWQEYEMSIRMAQISHFCYVDEALTVYRVCKSDKARLTNKYFEWLEAVKYIHEKHQKLYQKLNYIERYKVKNLVWDDARKRCMSSGLYFRYFMYEMLFLPYRLYRKVFQFE